MDVLVVRSSDERVIAGVASGIASRLRVDPLVVRAAAVVLALAGGVGLGLYVLAWVVCAEVPTAGSDRGSGRRNGAVGLMAAGVLVILRGSGAWLGDAIVLPVALVVAGAAVLWAGGGEREQARLERLRGRLPASPLEPILTGRYALARVAIGLGFVIGGVAAVVRRAPGGGLATAALVAGVVVLGAVVLTGPWLGRLAGELRDERHQRIRAQEREDMAAHLHDSVLQTLALIQRSGSSKEMASLARVQERELRTWLYGRADASQPTIGAAMEAVAARVEAQYEVPIEVVVVSDVPWSKTLRPLVDAAGEAMTNAAKHSEAARVSVYVEGGTDEVTTFVNDDGKGFDPAVVPPDRRGLADSVVGRLERHGGTAEIVSAPGEGTEVQLCLPRRSDR